MFPVIRPRLAVARGERLAERHRLHEADLVHRQRFALEKTGVAAHHRLELPLRDLVGSHPETPREGDELAGAGHPRELARLERLHRDRGVEHHRLGHRRGRGAWPESHPVQSTTHRTNRLLRHRVFISLRHGGNTLFDPVQPLNSHDTGQWHNPRTCCGAYWISTPSSRMCCSCFSQNKMKLEGTGLRHGQFFSIR